MIMLLMTAKKKTYLLEVVVQKMIHNHCKLFAMLFDLIYHLLFV